MLNIKTKQHVRLIVVEKPTAWLVVALPLETAEGETYLVGNPKVVKVIPKAPAQALPGKVRTFCLEAAHVADSLLSRAIPSPYIKTVFGYTTTKIVPGLGAQPPTPHI